MVHGCQVRSSGIDDDHVRPFADFKRADMSTQANGSGASDGCHLNHASGLHCGWIKCRSLVKFGHHVHFVKQIQIVITCTSIRAQTNSDAGL